MVFFSRTVFSQHFSVKVTQIGWHGELLWSWGFHSGGPQPGLLLFNLQPWADGVSSLSHAFLCQSTQHLKAPSSPLGFISVCPWSPDLMQGCRSDVWLRVGCGTAPPGTNSVYSDKACGATLFCSLCVLLHFKKKKKKIWKPYFKLWGLEFHCLRLWNEELSKVSLCWALIEWSNCLLGVAFPRGDGLESTFFTRSGQDTENRN